MWKIKENFGHPWDRTSGWDLLEIHSSSDELLELEISKAKNDGWELWIKDNSGENKAALCKKSSNGNKC